MVAQVVAIFLLLLGRRFQAFQLPGLMALWVVVVLALVSGIDYFRHFWRETSRPVPAPAATQPDRFAETLKARAK
jgi:phosphatidylglycerophosphate synthase